MKLKQLLLLLMLFVCGSACAQTADTPTYAVGKFLMEHGPFHLYPVGAISKKIGLEEKYALSCAGIGEKISSQEAVGTDGNLWEVEDAGDGYYYIKNNKGCYIPDDTGLNPCVGKGKGRALKAKLIHNVQGKFNGIVIQKEDESQWFNDLYGKKKEYSCVESQNNSQFSDPNYTFHFVTLDGKTIGDIDESYRIKTFKFSSPDGWEEYQGKEMVDLILETKEISFKSLLMAEQHAINKVVEPMLKRINDLGVEPLTYDSKKSIRDSILNEIRDYAVSKLPELVERNDSNILCSVAKWLCCVQRYKEWDQVAHYDSHKPLGEDERWGYITYGGFSNRWTLPALRALAKVVKPQNGYYIILDSEHNIESNIHANYSGMTQWTIDLVKNCVGTLDRDYSAGICEKIFYNVNTEKLYIGFFIKDYDYLSGLYYDFSEKKLKLPFDDSKFIGVELSEASLNGKETPIYHYLGMNSAEEAHKYLADKHNRVVQKDKKITADVAAKEAKEAAAAQAQFYALMTKKYGAKAVAAMKNNRPYVGMPAAILREWYSSGGWKVRESFRGVTVYGWGNRRIKAVNGKVTAIYTE